MVTLQALATVHRDAIWTIAYKCPCEPRNQSRLSRGRLHGTYHILHDILRCRCECHRESHDRQHTRRSASLEVALDTVLMDE